MINSYLMIPSNFFLNFSSISDLYSGLMSIEAYVNAESYRPDLWHSITVDVRMGTTCAGNLGILRKL